MEIDCMPTRADAQRRGPGGDISCDYLARVVGHEQRTPARARLSQQLRDHSPHRLPLLAIDQRAGEAAVLLHQRLRVRIDLSIDRRIHHAEHDADAGKDCRQAQHRQPRGCRARPTAQSAHAPALNL